MKDALIAITLKMVVATLALPLVSNLAYAQDLVADENSHPGVVALIDYSGTMVYRHFPSNVFLYVYDDDAPNESNCEDTCMTMWPPLFVQQDENESVGSWTIFLRSDGRRQWAYKSQPVYRFIHDSTEEPLGLDMSEGKWHVLTP